MSPAVAEGECGGTSTRAPRPSSPENSPSRPVAVSTSNSPRPGDQDTGPASANSPPRTART
ncbi:hypothetical protein [Kitasatospora sp. NRRL B-11411]|uniref:hypothetical protein n=1 Tax=Kitasatospora sp. NRRL B-11411 TaxID=1463822 RepID=UPI0012FEE952|nr:hypothetical protein [Kitasatospora sp. NRRL B-11411]